jgi:hypothetical protein
MKNLSSLLLLLIATFTSTAPGIVVAEGIPEDVAVNLETADFPGLLDAFVGSFTLTTDTVIWKPNKGDRHEVKTVVDVTRSPNGTVDRRLVRVLKDGEDVTDKRRKKVEKELAKANKVNDEDHGEDDMVTPFGESADRYEFGTRQIEGDTVTLAFEPKADHADEEGMARGTVAWNLQTLDPLWVEMTAITPPKLMKELSLRTEFARSGDLLFINQLDTRGVVKVLFLTREFVMDMRVSDLKVTTR